MCRQGFMFSFHRGRNTDSKTNLQNGNADKDGHSIDQLCWIPRLPEVARNFDYSKAQRRCTIDTVILHNI